MTLRVTIQARYAQEVHPELPMAVFREDADITLIDDEGNHIRWRAPIMLGPPFFPADWRDLIEADHPRQMVVPVDLGPLLGQLENPFHVKDEHGLLTITGTLRERRVE